MTGSKQFTPLNHQAPLPIDKLILKETPSGEDVVPLDVVFVGAGPAGLAGAIELAKLVKADPDLGPIEIGVLEKASHLGGHTLSGAVVNPVAFRELFPELKDSDFPFRRAVHHEKVILLTESGSIQIPTPPTMKNSGNQIGSLCEMVRWLGEKAEGLGVNIFTSFPAESLYAEGNKIVGVKTTAAGLNRDGSPGGQYMPPTQISSRVTVLSEGSRGTLSQAYLSWQKVNSRFKQIYALGVKEIWKVKQSPKEIIHTLGWPLAKEAFGGSFLYPLSDDTIALGLVVGLDYRDHQTDVHKMLQKMKEHPYFKKILEGGECLEWGAKTIPEGGYHSIPESLVGDGVMILGDSAGLVNVPALKGIHYAMKSGMLAARAIYKALKAQDTSAAALKSYQDELKESYVYKDLYKVRNMRHAFKDGFYTGGVKSVFMTLTGGAFPGDSNHGQEDAEDPKFVTPPVSEQKVGLSKVDAVYLSGNKTRDDVPQHLTVGKDVSPEIADFYAAMCPAGVYERQGDKLIVNSPNCVDCKATDVLGPRWNPREGGSGPNYSQM